MRKLSFFVFLSFYTQVVATIIPADRLITWQGNVGVPGGIPNRTITITLSPSGGNDQPAVQAAVDSVGNNGCIKLNAGNWTFNSVVRKVKNNFTIRGAGPGQTNIKCFGGGAFSFGQSDQPYPTTGNSQSVTVGATSGSSTFTVASTTNFTVGNLCHLSQLDPTFVVGNDPRNMIVMFKVVSKTGTTVTVDHPLPCDFPNSPLLVPYSLAPTTSIGLEDMTIDGQNFAAQGIWMEQTYGCWVKNVEITRSTARQMFLIVFNQGEIRHCTVHNVNGGGPNHEGIDFYNRSCWNWVEDNIANNGGFAPINFGDSHGGCVGNAVTFNYIQGISTASDTSGVAIALNHGGHNMFNLVEGNIVNTGISSDGYYGSASHNTVFRNWTRARAETVAGITTVQGFRAIQLNRMSNYWNVVGNILGDVTFPVDSHGAYDLVGSATQYNIYSLGFPNLGNFGYSGGFGPQTPPNYTLAPDRSLPNGYQGYDYNVRNTLLRHGNYDFFNHATLWDVSNADHNLPTSLIYSSKPTFFGNLTWPPIDQGSPNTMTPANIPAGYRFVNGGAEPPGGGVGPTPTPAPLFFIQFFPYP